MPEAQHLADEEMDDLIDQWHALPDDDPGSGVPLHSWLGLSWPDYERWVART